LYPIEIVKNRLQAMTNADPAADSRRRREGGGVAAADAAPAPTFLSVGRHIWQQDGVRGLMWGNTPSCIWVRQLWLCTRLAQASSGALACYGWERVSKPKQYTNDMHRDLWRSCSTSTVSHCCGTRRRLFPEGGRWARALPLSWFATRTPLRSIDPSPRSGCGCVQARAQP
jgi:hypothetical protein